MPRQDTFCVLPDMIDADTTSPWRREESVMAVSTRTLRRQADNDEPLVMTVPEAARMARVNPDTIRRWLRLGYIPAIKGGPPGPPASMDRRHWRIMRDDLETVLRGGSLNTPKGV
jgi:hypothetical protein